MNKSIIFIISFFISVIVIFLFLFIANVISFSNNEYVATTSIYNNNLSSQKSFEDYNELFETLDSLDLDSISTESPLDLVTKNWKNQLEFAREQQSGLVWKKIRIYDELVELFDPNSFDCGQSDEIKDRLNEASRDGESKKGFVPDFVVKRLLTNNFSDAYHANTFGANIVAHSFKYISNNSDTSKILIANDSPTKEDFSFRNYQDKDPQGYSSFYYAIDCSGYFSVSAKSAFKKGFLGLFRIEIGAEGEEAIEKEKSLFIIKGLMRSPLYSAYKGQGEFKLNINSDDSSSIKLRRLNTLRSIINTVPNFAQLDSTEILLNVNYDMIMTSNAGQSGYNGNGSIDLNFSFNIGPGSGNSDLQNNNEISRSSEYEEFTSFIITYNLGQVPDKIYYKDLIDLISELEAGT